MFDFIPVHDYTSYFNYAVLIMVVIAVWQCHTQSILRNDVVQLNAMWGSFIVIVLILYMGGRQVSGVFGDTINYAHGFRAIDPHKPIVWQWSTEWLFYNLMQVFAKYSNIHAFFTFCSAVYVGTLWYAMRRVFKSYYYIPFLVIISMFTFWAYGVNGVRNGMGSSLFILALTFPESPLVMILLTVIAIGFHKTVIVMAIAAIVAWFLKDNRYYVVLWLLCIPASLFFGMQLQLLLASSGMLSDDAYTGYLTGSNLVGETVQYAMVFHWDFLLYSAMTVAVGCYFIYYRKFRDEYYEWIFNIYLLLNAFWIIVIRSTYSNRIVQLSWFLMPIILIFPFLKQRFWVDHEKKLGYALLAFYAFAFYYNILR